MKRKPGQDLSSKLWNAGVNLLKQQISSQIQDWLFEQMLGHDPDLLALTQKIDEMKGEEFEELIATCFRRIGYHVENTPRTNDFGADLILVKNRQKTVVQVKRYKKNVGSTAVQEVVAALPYYRATLGLVVTNSAYTASAKKLAQANNITLWDRSHLFDLIRQAAQRTPAP
jgi:restriction system protein